MTLINLYRNEGMIESSDGFMGDSIWERIAQIAPLSGWTKSTRRLQIDVVDFSDVSCGCAAPKESFGAIQLNKIFHKIP
ncbi:MAG TPA: hypothetical protein DD473_17885 [Planctomycetaceae bacterium]|nr:hypothetical protein [Planctomycetaceae bacterium]